MSATPILDLEESLPAAPKRCRSRVLGVAIGLVVVAIPILADQGLMFDWNWPALNGLLLAPALFIAIAVHEIGHLIAGKLVGLDTGGISIGPLSLMRSGKNWVFDFNRQRLFGGSFKPLTSGGDLKTSRHIWTIACGPLASVLLAVLSGLWFLRHGNGA